MDVDIDTGGTFQANLLGSAHALAAPKVNNTWGLMRYHSAPSSVLAGLLDDDIFPASDDSEFARLLSDGIGSFSSLLDPKDVLQHNSHQPHFNTIAKEVDPFFSYDRSNKQHSQYLGGGSSYQEQLSQNPLTAISEYGLEETLEDFCMPLPAGVVQQAPHEPGHVDSISHKSKCASEAQVFPFKSGPIRQSSFPAEALSRLVTEENIDKLEPRCEEKLVGQSILPTSQVTTANTFSDVKCSNFISSPRRPNTLLRQSSSPAGLLSQFKVDNFLVLKEIRSMECRSGIFPAEFVRDGKAPVSGRGHGWDDNLAEHAIQHFVDMGQRKKGRGSDDKLLKGLQRSPVELATVTMSSFSPSSSSSPGSVDCLEGPAEESVLCKARAKRGCATHPRSIAERQRRIKISERMKKLQDLVPNLDKQASTAEMLDEVVEYVKVLQRQVQELSLNRPKCTGSCLQGGSPPQGHL